MLNQLKHSKHSKHSKHTPDHSGIHQPGGGRPADGQPPPEGGGGGPEGPSGGPLDERSESKRDQSNTDSKRMI